tara:strand:- start:300 stop:506 length:207 start_codon:yes stop_codon:yes gene_type:complete
MENKISILFTKEARAHFKEILQVYPYLKNKIEAAYREGHEDGRIAADYLEENGDWKTSISRQHMEREL